MSKVVLGIETSCDETAVCFLETKVIDASLDAPKPTSLDYKIAGSLVHSQIDIHREYGGVFPIMAKRAHSQNLVPLLEKLISDSKVPVTPIEFPDKVRAEIDAILEKETELKDRLFASSLITHKPQIDAIAVTYGPGLEPALWVGINFARALDLLWNIPIYPEHHMEGHIVSTLIEDSVAQEWRSLRTLITPALAVLISGGHTELLEVTKFGEYKLIGQTRDDAVGEAFDKVARMLGLPYPGGPEVSRKAAEARNKNYPQIVKLPRPMIHSQDFDFSFSGIKTAVLYALKDLKKRPEKAHTNAIEGETAPLAPETIASICREFEDSVVEVMEHKTRKALEKSGAQLLIVGGGVIANTELRTMFTRLAQEFNIPLYIPTHHLSGDNALMIALAGSLHLQLQVPPLPLTGAVGTIKLGK